MESSISRDDSRIDGQKMAEAVNAKYRKKKLVVGILILLFIAAIYLNVGYLIAGDIERACKNMVGSGLVETVMGNGVYLFCGGEEMAMWQWRLIQIAWPFVIAISAGHWLFLFIFDGGLIKLLALWPN
ncbi:hypothetical protein A3B05_01980 [Candidatus Giovannonibacteria bacterium RIFCSPLOWO2_01_FULL_43_160]|uniref:Uncharacterized protein n=2 Tax=Candidatus Giovannoniibacteriota TaxID=1752738 RepID=A0A0G1LV96_9BACT|nr:MAG: hypothetical protein UV72_C0002G0113 [Candidatus Giovannonibacteria bacterium GW2011_GWB1_43_13]KKS99903.1 MAG: hypothetical protein UV75_C0001G0068 [Candidatus Giovannonibacteria bacterium GW2011_GWA1_43_15]KKT21542.1 MAG: hypothetical protein UW05_C0008G0024 [Candidatus Giovannonibacteria bacterium GW2011_GWC2_43_8]KKT63604.1 MAG: hypothetical protein UW55_C0002G0069 [Candidatus Giovannonibacteria bacterium GW2011_GWA2_44_26]OGF58521.1 MAG: hypothetical protein A2652_01930 [Candidatus